MTKNILLLGRTTKDPGSLFVVLAISSASVVVVVKYKYNVSFLINSFNKIVFAQHFLLDIDICIISALVYFDTYVLPF
jgi:hypothetical protein